MKSYSYSEYFGNRKHRIMEVIYDACLKYYDISLYKEIENLLDSNILNDKIQNELNIIINNHLNLGPEREIEELNLDVIFENVVNKVLSHIYNTQQHPNGKMNFPDHKIEHPKFGEIFIDTKGVLVKKIYDENNNPVIDENGFQKYEYPSINNACGSMDTLAKNIYMQYVTNDNKIYKSFILFIFHDEDGNILDSIIVPTIYCIRLKKYNWEKNKLSSVLFAKKSNSNFNVPLWLPNFLQKRGWFTFEEKELLVATATYNYIEKNKPEWYKAA